MLAYLSSMLTEEFWISVSIFVSHNNLKYLFPEVKFIGGVGVQETLVEVTDTDCLNTVFLFFSCSDLGSGCLQI